MTNIVLLKKYLYILLGCIIWISFPNRLSALEIAPEDSLTDVERIETLESRAMISAEEKHLDVIASRDYPKASKVELALGLSVIPSDTFIVYLPLNLRVAYHFNEFVSLELSGSYLGCFSSEIGEDQARTHQQGCLRFPTSVYDSLLSTHQEATQIRKISLPDLQVARIYLNPVWSPFYGKFSAMNGAVVHYDFNLTAGVGVILTESFKEPSFSELQIRAAFEGNLGFGFRFLFLDYFGLRFDFRQYLYMKQDERGLGTASEFSVGFSFMI